MPPDNCNVAANGLPDVCTSRSSQPQGKGQYGYLVTAPQPGSYRVMLQLDDRGTTQAATARFYGNQTPQGGAIRIPASPKNTPSTPATFNITPPARDSPLELEAPCGNVAINLIVVSANH